MLAMKKLDDLRNQYEIAMKQEFYDLAACVATDAVEFVYDSLEEGKLSEFRGDLELMRWKAAVLAASEEIDLSKRGVEH